MQYYRIHIVLLLMPVCIVISYHKPQYLICIPTMPFTFNATPIAYLLGNLFPPPQLKEPCHLDIVHPLVLRDKLYNGPHELCKVRRGWGRLLDGHCSGHAHCSSKISNSGGVWLRLERAVRQRSESHSIAVQRLCHYVRYI